MTTEQSAVEVTQADRDAAFRYDANAVGVQLGFEVQEHPLAIAFARHRLANRTITGGGELVEALERIEMVVQANENIASHSSFHDGSSRRAVKAMANHIRDECASIRATLTASPSSDPMLTEAEEAELVERINGSPYLQPAAGQGDAVREARRRLQEFANDSGPSLAPYEDHNGFEQHDRLRYDLRELLATPPAPVEPDWLDRALTIVNVVEGNIRASHPDQADYLMELWRILYPLRTASPSPDSMDGDGGKFRAPEPQWTEGSGMNV